jgi:hypothetical protein
MKDVPLGYIEMRIAFEAAGDYGKWVRSRATVAIVNGIAFLHGGVSPMVAAMGCRGINDAVAADMASFPPDPVKLAALLPSTETGPLWYRGLASEEEATIGLQLPAILQQMQVRAFVVGHTPVLKGGIATRLDGRVVMIDTGMLGGTFYPGGVPSALEISGDTLTAIYLDRREPLAKVPPVLPAASN